LCYNGGILPNLRKSWAARLNLPFFLVAQAAAVTRWVALGGFDIVHCHWLITSGVMGAIAGLSTRVPLVVTAHGSDVFTESSLFRALDRWVLQRCCACTVNSRRSGQLVSLLNPSARIEAVPMGVDPAKYGKHLATPEARRRLGAGEPQILFVGRFSRNKGVPDLVRAMTDICAEVPRARLAVIGFGPDEDRIRATIADQGLDDRVAVVGRVARDEIPIYLASADLLVLPSIRIEGLGVVLLEALASETPVVGSDVGGIPDIISDGETGLLCRSGDPADIAATCVRMLSDPELHRLTALNGRRLVEKRFSWERIGARLESVLESCLSDGAAPAGAGSGPSRRS
jgi:glycosyltransferase involved in cell wall biosynthesis